MRCAAWLLAGALCTSVVFADTVRVEADLDATLIEDPAGALANGSGPFFFSGRNNQSEGYLRRALLRFPVAGALPDGAVIEEVSLVLFMSASNPAPRLFTLHRVQAEWSEGASASSGGGGAPSLPGDVTWIHRHNDTALWQSAGGDFLPPASAALEIGDTGVWTWRSADQATLRMRADVILWAAAPHRNFGWILIGDETTSQSVKSFASREHADPALRPYLEITYRLATPPTE
jgi:hypothetical protein